MRRRWRTRVGRAPGSPLGWLPHWLRPGGQRSEMCGHREGKVVFSEEVAWNPSKQADPQYHFDGINDSLRRAAAHLPRVDAIGGSAAGVYVNNEVRVGSLYRSRAARSFREPHPAPVLRSASRLGRHPLRCGERWRSDGAGRVHGANDNAVLGIAMGSSLAAGYVTPQGTITSWLNELAFVPVDYREGAPVDEWSGDGGVGAQYFSQQAVGRLLAPAGIELARRHAAAGETGAGAKTDGRGRRARAPHLRDHRRVLRLQHRATTRTSTKSAICWCWAA